MAWDILRWTLGTLAVIICGYGVYLLTKKAPQFTGNTDGDGKDRRAVAQLDIAGILAILYTIGFFAMVGVMMFEGLPPENKDALNQLIGGLTLIQSTIIGFYFGGSKTVETQQKVMEQRQVRSDAAVQKIVEAAAPAIIPGVVVTPDPANAHDGIVPAAEATKKDGDK